MNFEKEFTPADCQKVQAMASIGLPLHRIAYVMGISDQTLERMMKHRVAVREAIETGRVAWEIAFYKAASEKAISFESPRFSEFYAQVHFGWRKTTHIHLTGEGGAEKTIDEMTPVEREARIQKLIDVRTKLIAAGATDIIDVEADSDDGYQEEEAE